MIKILFSTILTTMSLFLMLNAQNPQPNILFIAVDDLNDFPSFGQRYPDAITPNIDKLAKQGMVFSNAHCQFPVCGPSRASIMTGLHPSTLGFDSNMKEDNELPNRALELNAELIHTYFNRNGYKTMAVGKLTHRRLLKGSVDVDGGRGSFTAGTGKLKKNWHQEGTHTDWAMAPERDDQLADYEAAEWAVNQLEGEHNKPFFLMVGFLRPHVPWYVPKKWYDLYDKTKLTLPPYMEDDLDDVPDVSKILNRATQMPTTEWAIQNNQWRNILHAYLACVSFVDHQVGKVLEALDASPYKDNTIIVFWSDHGYHMGEKNTFQKMTLWERSSHVPLIIDDPAIETGGRCDRVVSLLDIYPTLVELCGLPQNPKNEGRSLAPLLKNPTKNWPYPAITGWKQNSFAVQDERYRYIRYDDGSEELYDHQNDLHEWTNIADNPELANIKAELAKHIPQTNIQNVQIRAAESTDYGTGTIATMTSNTITAPDGKATYQVSIDVNAIDGTSIFSREENNGSIYWGVKSADLVNIDNKSSLYYKVNTGEKTGDINNIQIINFNAGGGSLTAADISELSFYSFTTNYYTNVEDLLLLSIGSETYEINNGETTPDPGVMFSDYSGTDPVTGFSIACNSDNSKNAWSVRGINVVVNWDASTSINESYLTERLGIAPNPVVNQFSIAVKPVSTEIYNLSGKLIKQFPEGVSNFDVSSLNTGVYIVKAKKKSGNVIVEKIVKY